MLLVGGSQRSWKVLALGLVGPWLLAAGCGPEPVTVDLVFPNARFLTLIDRAEVLAFRGHGETRCASLSTKARAAGLDVEPSAESGIHPVCDLDGGGVSIDLPAGDYDVLGVGRDANEVVLVVGCTRVHVGSDGGRASVVMANLSSEGQRRIEAAPSCASVQAYCRGSCEPE
jgi:hypothetical protein